MSLATDGESENTAVRWVDHEPGEMIFTGRQPGTVEREQAARRTVRRPEFDAHYSGSTLSVLDALREESGRYDASQEQRTAELAAAPGAKHTNPKDVIGSGKAPLELFPDSAVAAGSMAFLEGAVKYGRYNWRAAGVRSSIYVAALRRHLAAYWNGEDTDPDSGLPHLWKALACLAILIDAEGCGKLTDDRPPRADVARMQNDMAELVAELKERHRDKNPHQYTIQDDLLDK